jgi:phosphate transport system substrate-binding protein
MRFTYYLIFAIMFLLASCVQQAEKKPISTNEKNIGREKYYAGKLAIGVDTSIAPIIKQQTEIFTFINDSVQLEETYANEAILFDKFRKREVGVVIIPRQLSASEIARFKEKDTIYVRQIQLAYDAIALVGNKNGKSPQLSIDWLKQNFSPSFKSSSIKLVFDRTNESVLKNTLDLLGYTDKVSPNVYAVNSLDEVINYVAANKDAIGFIPYSYISDTDEERVRAILDRIKLLSLSVKDKEGKDRQASANQADIAEGIYPLTQNISALSRFSYSDNLEWLFMNFMFREKGARIFLKGGFVPAKIPERAINVNPNPVDAEKN